MPLQLPNLDDRTYADLVDEARRLIISYDPDWTNHNPSDPGITLVELFAYCTEILLYRMNRVTLSGQGKFLKLLSSPDVQPSDDPAVLAEQMRAAVLDVRGRFRAVTALDFEALAIEDFNLARPRGLPLVARAHCVPGKNLDRGTEAERAQPAPGHVSLVILPERTTPPVSGVPQPAASLISALYDFLDERRTLTTRHHVVGPTVSPVDADIIVARTSDAFDVDVKRRVLEQLASFFAPLDAPGGASEGWQFGRDVFVSEMHAQLEAVQGVDYVIDIDLSSTCSAAIARCVPASRIYHREGDLVGLALADDRLPFARLDPARVVIAPSTSVVSVQVTIDMPADAPDLPLLKRQVKEAARTFFSAFRNGPKPSDTTGADLLRENLEAALDALSVAVNISSFDVNASHRLPDAAATAQTATGARIAAGEVLNWRVRFSDN